MKKIIFIADRYYKKRSAIGNCLFNLIDVLKNEYKIEVITINYDLLEEKEIINNDILIHLVDTKLTNLEKKINKKNSKVIKFLYKLFFFLLLIENKLFQPRRGYKDNLKRYIKKLNEIENIDYIIPTCMPIETCVAAMKYCKKSMSTKYYPILFDLFTYNENFYNGKPLKKFAKIFNKKIEKNMLENSEHIFICNSWEKIIKSHYLEFVNKYTYIEHPLMIFKSNRINLGDKQTCVFAGNLLKGHNDINDFLNIFINYEEFHDYRINIYSNLGNTQDEKYENIVYGEWLNYDEYIKTILNAYIIISLSEFKGRQMCSKIFECISYGKPIIQIIYHENDINVKFLKKYPAALILNINDSIETNLKKINFFLKKLDVLHVNFEELKDTFNKLTPSYVANQIKDEIDI